MQTSKLGYLVNATATCGGASAEITRSLWSCARRYLDSITVTRLGFEYDLWFCDHASVEVLLVFALSVFLFLSLFFFFISVTDF